MAISKTPVYDSLHPVIQDRINSIIGIEQRSETGSYTPSPKDDELREQYAVIPKEDLHDILKAARAELIEKGLEHHIKKNAHLGLQKNR